MPHKGLSRRNIGSLALDQRSEGGTQDVPPEPRRYARPNGSGAYMTLHRGSGPKGLLTLFVGAAEDEVFILVEGATLTPANENSRKAIIQGLERPIARRAGSLIPNLMVLPSREK